MKQSRYFIVAGLVLAVISAAFPSSLMFKKAGVPVFSVQNNSIVWLAKPPINENSATDATSQGLEIKRGDQLRLWTNNDNVHIKGIVVPVPSPVPTLSLSFKKGTANETTVYPSPAVNEPALGCGNGGDNPANLSSQDMYLENHVSHSDPVGHTTQEYCNYGDGRIEYIPGEGNRLLLYHKDHLGSTRAVESVDGSAVERVVYDAYGAVTTEDLSGAEKPGKDKFTGKEVDHEGGSPTGVSVIKLNIRVSAIPIELIHKLVYLTLSDGTRYDFNMIRSIGDDSYNVNQQIEINGSAVLKTLVIEIMYNPGDPDPAEGFTTECGVGVFSGCGFDVTVPGGKTQEINFDHPYTDATLFPLTTSHIDCHNNEGNFVLPAQTTNAVAGGMKLYYFGARYFDADIGKWITIDPGKQFYDSYKYSNNPIAFFDPDGKAEINHHIIYSGSRMVDQSFWKKAEYYTITLKSQEQYEKSLEIKKTALEVGEALTERAKDVEPGNGLTKFIQNVGTFLYPILAFFKAFTEEQDARLPDYKKWDQVQGVDQKHPWSTYEQAKSELDQKAAKQNVNVDVKSGKTEKEYLPID